MKAQAYLLLPALSLFSPALAAWANLSLSDYQLQRNRYSDIVAELTKVLPRVPVGNIVERHTNHKNPSKPKPKVKNLLDFYTWDDVKGYDDVNTEKWYPQGLSTSADALEGGKYGENRVHLVSWHSDNYKTKKLGARISFINMNTKKGRAYRNVLLVVPKNTTGKPDFAAITDFHAGGILWYGSLLFAASTYQGLRVFDMNIIYRVEKGKGMGRVGRKKYQASGYEYVIPQIRTFTWVPKRGVKPLKSSFVGLDRTQPVDRLITGEYNRDGTSRIIHFDMDYTSNAPFVNVKGVATASRAVSHDLKKIQGAVTINNRYFLTQSGGSLITFSWTGRTKVHRNVFPGVPQDLSYEPGVGLWTLMESPGKRHVVAVDYSKF